MKRMNGKETFLSLLMFLMGFIGLCALFALFVGFSYQWDIYGYVKLHTNDTLFLVTGMAILCGILYFYMYFEDDVTLSHPSRIVEVFIILYIAIGLSHVMALVLNANARPLVFLSLMAIALVGRKEAIFFTVIFALMQFMLDRYLAVLDISDRQSYASLICTFCSGTIGIFVSQNLRRRVQSVFVFFIILIPIETCLILLELVNTESVAADIAVVFGHGALDALLSVMLCQLLLPVFEVIFSELTVFRLRELTSDNGKLIKQLKTKAPGTYNHSVVVAQLAEACARAVGEDSELARAAAFYHDVGKLKNPEMFTENQLDGVNLHNELSPELSVDIIRTHAQYGAKLIKKYHLPDFFADVALQHHGTLPIRYFYAKALKMSDGDIPIENFSYYGPRPKDKITAIIMIVDACEAATRSLSTRDPQSVEALVRNIIEERMDLEQFDYCNITMAELTAIRRVVVQQLSGVHHSRVAYPKLKIKKGD